MELRHRERQSCISADKVSRYYSYLPSAMERRDALRAMGYDRDKSAPKDGADARRTMEFIGSYSLVPGACEPDPVVE